MSSAICSHLVARHSSEQGRMIECGTRKGSAFKTTLHIHPNEDQTAQLSGIVTKEPRGYVDRLQVSARFGTIPNGIELTPNVEYDIVYTTSDGSARFYRA